MLLDLSQNLLDTAQVAQFGFIDFYECHDQVFEPALGTCEMVMSPDWRGVGM
jgi:hypothetical protein